MTARAPRFPMRRTNRLASAGQIAAVYASGRRATASAAGCAALVSQGGGDPKVAVVAGRKVGGAVARNRAKRRLRAALDPLVGSLAPGTHAVVGATSRTNEVTFQKLSEDVARVLARSGALSDA